jgi:hypothetical protein
MLPSVMLRTLMRITRPSLIARAARSNANH